MNFLYCYFVLVSTSIDRFRLLLQTLFSLPFNVNLSSKPKMWNIPNDRAQGLTGCVRLDWVLVEWNGNILNLSLYNGWCMPYRLMKRLSFLIDISCLWSDILCALWWAASDVFVILGVFGKVCSIGQVQKQAKRLLIFHFHRLRGMTHLNYSLQNWSIHWLISWLISSMIREKKCHYILHLKTLLMDACS